MDRGPLGSEWEEEPGKWEGGWRMEGAGSGGRGEPPGKRAGTPQWPVCAPVLQNPDIVLVHYLNVPALEDCGKGCSPIFCSISSDRREWLKWSREELLGQLKPMCKGLPGGRGAQAVEGRRALCPAAWGERLTRAGRCFPEGT